MLMTTRMRNFVVVAVVSKHWNGCGGGCEKCYCCSCSGCCGCYSFQLKQQQLSFDTKDFDVQQVQHQLDNMVEDDDNG